MSDLNKKIDNKYRPRLNSEQQEQFLQETLSGKHAKAEVNRIISVFKRFEPYEKENHCDLLLLDDDIIIEVIGSFKGSSSSLIRKYWAPLSKYEKWCASKGLPVTGNIKRARKKSPYPGLQVISSPTQLSMMIDDFFEPINKNMLDNLTRMITWCIYSGMAMDDIEKLERKNLDFENQRIHTANGSYEMYAESMMIFHNICKLKEYNVSIKGGYIKKIQRPQRYIATYPDYFKSKFTDIYISRMRYIREKKGKDNRYLSSGVVSDSGKFYRIYVKELMGTPVEFQNLTEFGGDDGGENKSAIKQEAIHNYKIWRKAAHPEYREYEP